jgi:hypothetical protein
MDNSLKARLLCETYLTWHAVSLLDGVLIEEQHARCGLPRGFSGPGERLRVVLRVNSGSETWAYVVQFIAVTLLTSFQTMKERKFLGLAIAREMNIAAHSESIGLQRTSGNGSECYFDLRANSNGSKA